jgi:5-methylcytosine-specific restriction endonuclease McrA
MPQKLDWADRHLFVAKDARHVTELLARNASYEDALLQARKAVAVLDGRVVTKRELQSLLKELKRKPPTKFLIFPDVALINQLKYKYDMCLAECNDASEARAMVSRELCTKAEIKALIANSYDEISNNKLRFRCWSDFVSAGRLTRSVTVLFCDPNSVRVFLKCTTKAELANLRKAVAEELPFVVCWNHSDVCLFGRDVWKLSGSERGRTPAELKLLLLGAVDRERQKLESLQRRFSGDAGRKLDPLRQPIPESVRTYVWRRDEGKCVICGSQDRLEFDHIIPVIKGGGNTARNIQLLCEQCNRTKKDRI